MSYNKKKFRKKKLMNLLECVFFPNEKKKKKKKVKFSYLSLHQLK